METGSGQPDSGVETLTPAPSQHYLHSLHDQRSKIHWAGSRNSFQAGFQGRPKRTASNGTTQLQPAAQMLALLLLLAIHPSLSLGLGLQGLLEDGPGDLVLSDSTTPSTASATGSPNSSLNSQPDSPECRELCWFYCRLSQRLSRGNLSCYCSY